MKNIDSHIKSSKYKRRHSQSESPELSHGTSDSESDVFPLSKECTVVANRADDDDSTSDNSSPQRIRRTAKKKRHKCKHKDVGNEERIRVQSDEESQRIRSHHHTHKKHHKAKGGDHKRRHDEVRIKLEPVDHHTSRHSNSSSQRRLESRGRERTGELEYSNHSHSSRQWHHREDGSCDRVRHHRRREDMPHRDRGEPSHKRRHSMERDQRENEENKRSGVRAGRSRWKDNEDDSVIANRPIKQEPVSDEEPNYEWGRKTVDPNNSKNIPTEGKAKPNFGLSGKLAEDTNTFNGVVIKYSEPPEARKPKRRWRFYPFKGEQGLPTLFIHRQSCYLIGRDRKVADIPVDHPSCSKQHAALQYRLVPYDREDGTKGRRVRPYIIDLESANGTFVNNVKVEHRKYVELLEKDVVKFGYSSREYVLLHEHSKDDEMDDDIPVNE